jgi:hypothetical protein
MKDNTKKPVDSKKEETAKKPVQGKEAQNQGYHKGHTDDCNCESKERKSYK